MFEHAVMLQSKSVPPLSFSMMDMNAKQKELVQSAKNIQGYI